MKKHYTEHLGKLNKEAFVSILKRHLLTWYPNLPNRSKILIKLLSRLFDEIDLNSNMDLEQEEFVYYFFDHQEELDDLMYNNLSNKTENIISHCFYPRSIQHQCELVRKGFSRIRHGDPFLKEIDYFIEELQSMNN